MNDLKAELESLRQENARLRKLLKLTDAEAVPARGTQTAWFDKAPGPVDTRSSPQANIEFYAALFGARRDVYAVRWENARTGKSGWMPALEGGWRKGRPASDIRHLPLTPEVLAADLAGNVEVPVLAAALTKRAPGSISLGFTDPASSPERSASSGSGCRVATC